MSWEIKFFKTSRGDEPVKDFINKLDEAAEAKVFRLINTVLRQYGPTLTMPYSKRMSANLYELRITGRTEVRVFYSFKNNDIYLLHVFQKKSQKTPGRELETAKKRLEMMD